MKTFKQFRIEIFNSLNVYSHVERENKGMMSTLAGTKLGVSCLEVIMFTPKCPHAEIACRAAGSCISVCCLCQRGIPIERNLSLKYKWRGQGEALDHFYQRNKSFPFKLISSCWLTMSCHWLWPIQSSTAIIPLPSTCSIGNQRPCKGDEDLCELMSFGIWLKACNECQLIEQLLIVVRLMWIYVPWNLI